MWPFSGCDVDACTATDPNAITTYTILSLLPFAGIYITSHTLAVRNVYPRLSSGTTGQDGEGHVLPSHAPAALRQVHAEHGAKSLPRRVEAWTFGAVLGLAATLGALILAEILEVGNQRGKALALGFIVPLLLALLVAVVPWLECRSLVTAAGGTFQRSGKGRLPVGAWVAQGVLFGLWLFVFWTIGGAVPESIARTSGTTAKTTTAETRSADSWVELLTRGCLERVGVVGIGLMALLAGFASVSSPWHTFSDATNRRRRPVTEADVNRRQAGLDAAGEMLLTKRHRLQMLERTAADSSSKASSSGSGSVMGKMMGSIRGATSGDEQEMRALRMEIAGLETMEANLTSTLSLVRDRRDATLRASTATGQALLIPSYAFACYCVYRILATALTTLRRTLSPYPSSGGSSFSGSDPINRLLGLLVRHWNADIDQAAWARLISFAMSGVILLLSAGSVVQTARLFSRWCPPLIHRHARASLALAAGQVAATYVISSALMLRSHLPGQVSSVVGGALAGSVPLMSPAFADQWFEGWFLVGGALTAVGVWIGRSVAGGWDDDEYGMEEMGTKRS